MIMTEASLYRIGNGIYGINESDSRDEITSITANNFTERAPSIVEDDVGSENIGSNLDLVPVRERESSQAYHKKDPIEIVDVYTQSRLVDESQEMSWRHEVDKYDLNGPHHCPYESHGFSDEELQTVVQRHRPPVTLTRHEAPQIALRQRSVSPVISRQRSPHPVHEPENLCRHSASINSSDIGRQISQLAQRIESLGNISRVYRSEPTECPCGRHCQLGCTETCLEPPTSDQHCLEAARKVDKVERIQKRQEAMQSRLVELTKKLGDSTRELHRAAVDEEMETRGPSPKVVRKAGKKGRRGVSRVSGKPSSSFLHSLVGGDGGEAPLLSSSYCLHQGTPESVLTEETGSTNASKVVVEELACIRREFREQVDEIRRLLSERYQHGSGQATVGTEARQESLETQIDRAVSLARGGGVGTGDSLRNITNLGRLDGERHVCPLDKYLERKPLEPELPTLESDLTPSLRPGILPSVARAIRSKQRMFSDPVEAERFLVELRNRRANLENNISCLERAKEGQFLFSVLEKLQGDESSSEMARIQAMVDDAIVAAGQEVQCQVRQEFDAWLEKRRRLHELEEQQQQHQEPVRATKVVQHVNYHQAPRRPAVVQGRYGAVCPRVDSGLRKPPQQPPPPPRAQPQRTASRPTATPARPAWANRRRCRTPYLHFVNELKLAKRAVAPLADSGHKVLPTRRDHVTKSTEVTRSTRNTESLIPIGVRQYSLNYNEEAAEVEKPQAVARATSPKTESTTPRPPTPPSPSLSEVGTGFQVTSKRPIRPREERVGPFSAVDPLEEQRIQSQPVNVVFRPPPPPRDRDIGDLRQLIERALYDQIDIPSPTTSTDLTLSVPKAARISTPAASERDRYSEDFGSETPRERTDRSMTLVDGVRTPDMSRMSTDHDHNPRFETPPASPTRSLRTSPKRVASEAVQTIAEKGNQTEEEKAMQTASPNHTQTPRVPRPPAASVDSFSTTSGLEASLSDTQVDSWSDGMWLLDRSEGEMAQHYLQPVDRWGLGPCPDNPRWPHGTEELARPERRSTQSFGEFTRPSLPGLVPTADGMLQLKTLPFRGRPPSVGIGGGDDDDDGSFKLIRMSRDSRSRLTTPGSTRRSPGNSEDSDGEVRLACDSYDDGDGPRSPPKSARSRPEPSPRVDRADEPFQPMGVRRSALRQSNESNGTELSRAPADSYSADRVRVDPMRYLRGSKQSQSDLSDTGGLMSTGQVIAAAFAGGDSGDFDAGPSDAPRHQHHDAGGRPKAAVVVPTLESIEQSDRTPSDLSEIVL